jgi:phage/conjugal plasmid C-4 type zinc finger TraR family protein
MSSCGGLSATKTHAEAKSHRSRRLVRVFKQMPRVDTELHMSRGFGGSDFAQVQGELANTESIKKVLEQEREQAEHARDRKAQGAYGICEDCGQEIAAERLAALPGATRCVACQGAWEDASR